MGKAATDIANNPPPDNLDDVKPGLSEQELAALSDGDDDDASQVVADGEPSPDPDNSLASPSPEAQAKDDAAASDGTAAADVAGDDAESGTPPNAEPEEIRRGAHLLTEIRPTRQFADNIAGRIGAVDTEIDGLETKLEEGELQLPDFMRRSRELNNLRQDLVADAREQEILQNTNAALNEGDWNGSVAGFMGENENFQNPIMMGALEAALKELYTVPENVGSSHYWYLETARRAVLEQITPAEATLDNPPDNEGTPQQTAQQKIAADGKARSQTAAADRKAIPATLGAVPAAEDNPGDDDEFSHLDRMEGVELEQTLAKMSEAQTDRYLRAGE